MKQKKIGKEMGVESHNTSSMGLSTKSVKGKCNCGTIMKGGVCPKCTEKGLMTVKSVKSKAKKVEKIIGNNGSSKK